MFVNIWFIILASVLFNAFIKFHSFYGVLFLSYLNISIIRAL